MDKRSKLTVRQIACLHAFADLQMKMGKLVRIDYKGQIGVTVTLQGGHRAFYSLNAIMDPINRLTLSNPNRAKMAA